MSFWACPNGVSTQNRLRVSMPIEANEAVVASLNVLCVVTEHVLLPSDVSCGLSLAATSDCSDREDGSDAKAV